MYVHLHCLGFDFNDYYIIFATPHWAMLMTTLYITKIAENKKSIGPMEWESITMKYLCIGVHQYTHISLWSHWWCDEQVSSDLRCCCGKQNIHLVARWSMYSHKRFAKPLTEAWDPRPLELNHFLGCLSAENDVNCQNNQLVKTRLDAIILPLSQPSNANNRFVKLPTLGRSDSRNFLFFIFDLFPIRLHIITNIIVPTTTGQAQK